MKETNIFNEIKNTLSIIMFSILLCLVFYYFFPIVTSNYLVFFMTLFFIVSTLIIRPGYGNDNYSYSALIFLGMFIFSYLMYSFTYSDIYEKTRSKIIDTNEDTFREILLNDTNKYNKSKKHLITKVFNEMSSKGISDFYDKDIQITTQVLNGNVVYIYSRVDLDNPFSIIYDPTSDKTVTKFHDKNVYTNKWYNSEIDHYILKDSNNLLYFISSPSYELVDSDSSIRYIYGIKHHNTFINTIIIDSNYASYIIFDPVSKDISYYNYNQLPKWVDGISPYSIFIYINKDHNIIKSNNTIYNYDTIADKFISYTPYFKINKHEYIIEELYLLNNSSYKIHKMKFPNNIPIKDTFSFNLHMINNHISISYRKNNELIFYDIEKGIRILPDILFPIENNINFSSVIKKKIIVDRLYNTNDFVYIHSSNDKNYYSKNDNLNPDLMFMDVGDTIEININKNDSNNKLINAHILRNNTLSYD